MADSTPNLPQMLTSQANKETFANEMWAASSPASLYARNFATTSGLTWGFIGGRWNGSAIANGTVSLTSSSTNYVVANRTTGAVSVSTSATNWNNTTDYLRLYLVVTGTTTATSFQDHRQAYGQTPVLGFAAGQGGAVTQDTSKSTGVTLNTITGQITMNAAALAANTTVTFALTDSNIGTNDNLIVHRKAGGTAASYLVWCDAVAAGSAVIALRNLTAGSLSEAVVLQFSIVKGAIA